MAKSIKCCEAVVWVMRVLINWTGRRTADGAALFLVLWAVMVISTALIVAASLVDLDLEDESMAARRFMARQLALSGLAIASDPNIEPGNSLLNNEREDGSAWEVRLLGENARINPNRLVRSGDFEGLKRLFADWGLEEREIDGVIDSITDWIDEDEFRSLNGAEAADIALDSGYSRPENRPLLAVEELARVRGMDLVADVKPDWQDYFSVNATNQFDLQYVGAEILSAFGGIDTSRAQRFVELRAGEDGILGTGDDVVFETVDDALAALGVTAAEEEFMASRFGVNVGPRRIESIGRVGPAEYKITVVMDRGESDQPMVRHEQ